MDADRKIYRILKCDSENFGRLFKFFKTENGDTIGTLRKNDNGIKATIFKEKTKRWNREKRENEYVETGGVLLKADSESIDSLKEICRMNSWTDLVVELNNPFY